MLIDTSPDSFPQTPRALQAHGASDVLLADAFWTEVDKGIEYVSYFSEVAARCPRGQAGTRTVSFSGDALVDVQIPLDLSEAAGSATVVGTESTFLSCGDTFRERSRPRRFEIRLDLTAIADPEQSMQEICADLEGGPGLATATSTFRSAEGSVTIGRKTIDVEGGISRQEVTDAPGTPCSFEEL